MAQIQSLFSTRPVPVSDSTVSATYVAVTLAATVALTFSVAAHAQQRAVPITIGPQPLSDALLKLGQQTNLQFIYQASLLQGLNTRGVKGTLTPEQALDQLLSGSSLRYSRQGNTITLIQRAQPQVAATAAAVDDVTQLGAIVAETYADPGITEGSGSYTSQAMGSSTRLSLSPRETPQSVTVMTRQRMDDQGITQLSDLVQQTPGLAMDSAGNAGSDSSMIYSRGFEIDNYLIDGVGQVNSNYSSIFQTSDMALFDRVEIVRGATGLMSGLGSPGGALNMIRKKPTQEFQALAKLEMGSWDHYRSEVDVATPLNEEGTVRGRVVGVIQNNHSYLERLREKKRIFYATVEADLTPSTLARMGFSYLEDNITGHARSGRPGFFSDGMRTEWSRSDSAAADWAFSKRRNQSFFVSLEHRFENDWLVKGTYNYASSRYNEVIGYAAGGYPNRESGQGVSIWAGRWAGKPRQNSLDIYATGPYTLFGRRHDLVVGATLTHTEEATPTYGLWRFNGWDGAISNIDDWDGSTPGAPVNPASGRMHIREKSASAYITTRLRPADDLSVILGARMTSWDNDKRNYDLAGAETSAVLQAEHDKLTPYVGIVYDISKAWSLYAGYTSIFKPQTYQDTSGNYLKPLLGNSYEFGVKGSLLDDRLNVSAAVFYLKQDNLGVALPGEYAPNGNSAYESVSGARTRGFELEVSGEVLPNWQLSAGFTRSVSKDKDGGVLSTEVAQNVFKLFTTYHMPNVGNGLTLGAGVRTQSAIYQDGRGPNGERFTQKGYAVVDLMGRYAITDKVSAYVNVYNLLDKKYYSGVGTAYYGAPLSMKVGLDIRY
ncbi:TonB-dependent siderophore receptor [Advenella mimigardefordensis]|uniref:TonB-dependent receptor Plug domain-containing protein n=1 Tax=Advenella mimigardefordensis (strain DSM 17166 / LMG 22922 / DPN7) TaxID=1247726 RepID=W0PGW5_ADVMD|nr:TonB-dependent receptor [Advenella mimigardefordensis]AHG64635.1 TonB-dependent receptor Plug domain-containing protein [Advenella mimigardefordensis DPN7]